MRVLMLSWEYPPVVYGGLARHVHGLSAALARAGHQVTVLTQHGSGAAHDVVENDVRVIRVEHDPPLVPMDDLLAWTLALDHTMSRTALSLLDDQRPDVVHGHDWLIAHAGATLKEAWRIPLVSTVHATEAGRYQGWLPGALNQAIHSVEWWMTYQARRVITCSDHMRWEVTRLFELPADKVEVIRNGVDAAAWRSDRETVAAASRRYAGEGPLLLFSGRLEYEKGVQTVLTALPRLRRRHPGLRLLVAGRGTQEQALRAEARRLRLGRSVQFVGWLDEPELAAVAAAADVAVMPSLYEPFGLVALEDAAAGTPVVATDRGGLAEVVGGLETGLTVPPEDPGALALAIDRLLSDDILARRIGREARRTVARDFSWDSVAERTARTYVRAVREEGALRARGVVPVQPEIRSREGNLLRDGPVT